MDIIGDSGDGDIGSLLFVLIDPWTGEVRLPTLVIVAPGFIPIPPKLDIPGIEFIPPAITVE